MTTDASRELFRATALAGVGRHDTAIALLRAALTDEPSHPGLLAQLADELFLTGRVEEAIAGAEAALAEAPYAVGPRITLAKAALQQRRFDDALRLSEEVLERQPENAQAMLFQALVLARSRRRGRAGSRATPRENIRRALELAADDPECLHWAAQVERRLRDEKAAMRYARAGLAIDPTSTALLVFTASSPSTPERDRFPIISGLLAENPLDPQFRSLMRLQRWRNRRSRYDLQWISVVVVAVVGSVTGGGALAVVGTVLALGGTIAWWRVKTNAVSALPRPLRSLDRRIAKVVLALVVVLWALLLLLGAITLAVGLRFGVLFLIGALLASAVSTVVIDIEEYRAATREDRSTGTDQALVFVYTQLVRSVVIGGILSVLTLVVSDLGELLPGRGGIVATCGVIAFAFMFESSVLFGAVSRIVRRSR